LADFAEALAAIIESPWRKKAVKNSLKTNRARCVIMPQFARCMAAKFGENLNLVAYRKSLGLAAQLALNLAGNRG